MWKEMKQKIEENNNNGSPTIVEWSSDGEDGRGRLTGMEVSDSHVEFFITDDRPEIGSFSMRSSRAIIGISPQEGNDLHIFSHYMGSITLLHDR